jgi:hypothetical protein
MQSTNCCDSLRGRCRNDDEGVCRTGTEDDRRSKREEVDGRQKAENYYLLNSLRSFTHNPGLSEKMY